MKEYLNLIDSFINKEIDFDRFYSDFNTLYRKEESSQLPENEFAFIDAINEKLFFAAKDPSDEEKQKYNYVDEAAFFDWLKQKKDENIKLWS
jgi:hypothetical protein